MGDAQALVASVLRPAPAGDPLVAAVSRVHAAVQAKADPAVVAKACREAKAEAVARFGLRTVPTETPSLDRARTPVLTVLPSLPWRGGRRAHGAGGPARPQAGQLPRARAPGRALALPRLQHAHLRGAGHGDGVVRVALPFRPLGPRLLRAAARARGRARARAGHADPGRAGRAHRSRDRGVPPRRRASKTRSACSSTCAPRPPSGAAREPRPRAHARDAARRPRLLRGGPGARGGPAGDGRLPRRVRAPRAPAARARRARRRRPWRRASATCASPCSRATPAPCAPPNTTSTASSRAWPGAGVPRCPCSRRSSSTSAKEWRPRCSWARSSAGVRRLGRADAVRYVHLGWMAALPAGVLTWWLASRVIAVRAADRELSEAVIALLAAAVLFSMSFWMISKVESRRWTRLPAQGAGDEPHPPQPRPPRRPFVPGRVPRGGGDGPLHPGPAPRSSGPAGRGLGRRRGRAARGAHPGRADEPDGRAPAPRARSSRSRAR